METRSLGYHDLDIVLGKGLSSVVGGYQTDSIEFEIGDSVSIRRGSGPRAVHVR